MTTNTTDTKYSSESNCGSMDKQRSTILNHGGINSDGRYVLYWMTSSRRVTWNFALDFAVAEANRLRKTLLIMEPLRVNSRWSSRRFHEFIVDGMKEHSEVCRNATVAYYPYIESESGAATNLLDRLAENACLIVTDDFPCCALSELKHFARRFNTRSVAIDSNGILPMTSGPKTFTTAYSFRRFLHKELRPHLLTYPIENGLERLVYRCFLEDLVDEKTLSDFPATSLLVNTCSPPVLDQITYPSIVNPVTCNGGTSVAVELLSQFLETKLTSYGERNQPDKDVQSHLSPYLHFGHISAHEILYRVLEKVSFNVLQLSEKATGQRQGWWNLSAEVEGFLDQLITWRELGFNMCSRESNYAQYESLPDWALKTLEAHSSDNRPEIYTLEQLEHADTADSLWNAAQFQLLKEGVIHNYLRMLWGKKIFQWSPSPREALSRMIHLNNKYALDGRNPNSYAGIFWVLGRYDRAWGPERPIFGKIRYMTSENTLRKLRLSNYLAKYSGS